MGQSKTRGADIKVEAISVNAFGYLGKFKESTICGKRKGGRCGVVLLEVRKYF